MVRSCSWSAEAIHNQPPAQGFPASRNSIWLETYLSDMHPCKEVLITFMQNDNFTTRPIVLGNSTVQCVTAYKLLGIIVINDLKYNEHIDYRSKKASKRLYSLRILKKVRVNKERIVKVYLTTIRPIQEYGVQAWLDIPELLEISWGQFKKGHFIWSIHAIVTQMPLILPTLAAWKKDELSSAVNIFRRWL